MKWASVATLTIVLVGSVISGIILMRGSSPASTLVSDSGQVGLAPTTPAAGDGLAANILPLAKTGEPPSVPFRARPVPWIDTLSDNFGTYYLVSNGPLQFQLYTTGALTGQMASLKYQGREMLDDKRKGYA